MHCLAFVWSGHGYYSFNCDRAGLEAIHNGNMAHEGGFANKEFHPVDIHLQSNPSSTAIRLRWWSILACMSLAPQPGIKMP